MCDPLVCDHKWAKFTMSNVWWCTICGATALEPPENMSSVATLTPTEPDHEEPLPPLTKEELWETIRQACGK